MHCGLVFVNRLRYNAAMKQINLIADDYGLSPAVSKGILKLLRADKITGTSCMTNSDSWQDSAADLKTANLVNTKSIGLHFNLTTLKPLSLKLRQYFNNKVPSLNKVLLLTILRQLPIDLIEQELTLQVECFIQYIGRAPDFIDGHQHVHVFPTVQDVIIRIARKYNISYIRNCNDSVVAILNRKFKVKALILKLLATNFSVKLKQGMINFNTSFSGIYDFNDNIAYDKYFAKFLKHIKPNAILMCHPGYVDSELQSLDHVTTPRLKELKFLKSANFDSLLLQNKIKINSVIQ